MSWNGRSRNPRLNWLAITLIIIGAVILFGMISRIFPWWVWVFFIIPMSGGWLAKVSEWFGTHAGGSHTDGSDVSAGEKAKRYDASRVPESVLREDEKYKRGVPREPREPRYALGDDGELIELPPDEYVSESRIESRPESFSESLSDMDTDTTGDADADNPAIPPAPSRQLRHDDYI